MKKIIALLGAASLLTLSSCDLAMLGEGTMGRRDTQRIERGMSQEQVYSLMGRPTYRRFGDNGIEEWEYHKSGLFEKRITVISFSSGRVVRMIHTMETTTTPIVAAIRTNGGTIPTAMVIMEATVAMAAMVDTETMMTMGTTAVTDRMISGSVRSIVRSSARHSRMTRSAISVMYPVETDSRRSRRSSYSVSSASMKRNSRSWLV